MDAGDLHAISTTLRDSKRGAGMKTTASFFAMLIGLGFLVETAVAQSDFDAVAEIFSRRCVSCHNNTDEEGGFSLETKASFADYSSAGDPKNSELLEVLVSHENRRPAMPKGGEPLTDQQVETIRKWIPAGDIWADHQTIPVPQGKDFDSWAYQPIVDPPVPIVAGYQSPIDAFIALRRNEQGLAASPPADRRTLIRRVTYDLTGLPPSLAEVRNFENDPSQNAFEKVVDRLLASPHYGERWAQHWLDVVKYADTCGYDKDKLRNNAWPYRDYVIRSLNTDKPYSRFVEEQIAGDVLYPGTPDGILGLGFIAAGPWDFIGHVEVPESKIDGLVARNLDRDEMVTNTINTFSSLTIQCARCHDHKFDPFTQHDYYRLQAIFAAVDRADRVYDDDPATRTQRRQLASHLQKLENREQELQAKFETAASKELAALQTRIDEIEKARPKKRPEFGYHGSVSSNQLEEQWVEVDLQSKASFSQIVLRPCHDEFANIGAGFGFPLRFKVEVDGKRIFQTGQADYSNPGMKAVTFAVSNPGRVIRVTATKLCERGDQFNFALAEIQAVDDDGTNLALNQPVRARNSVEAPVRWAKKNLTDGIWLDADRTSKQSAELASQLNQLKVNVLGNDEADELEQLRSKIATTRKEMAELPTGKVVYAATTHFKPEGNFQPTKGKPRPIRLLLRGDVTQPDGDELGPGVLPISQSQISQSQFRQMQYPNLEVESDEGQRRVALARWISSLDNPLTWRSIVNRVWQHHFGQGIVATPNDFGRMGSVPTHPELLDWLASRFKENGGSMKELHRMILLSRTYQQSSANMIANQELDAGNRFLWRMPRRKLSAEEIRDSILMASGKLDTKMGGPGYYLFELEKTEHSPHYQYHQFDHRDQNSYRRSVYRFVARSQPDPFMTTMDCADNSQSTPRRNETQTALQALSLLNNQFNLVMAEHLARRIATQPDTKSQVNSAVELMLSREASQFELDQLVPYAEQHGLQNLARVLFNLSEFVFLD